MIGGHVKVTINGPVASLEEVRSLIPLIELTVPEVDNLLTHVDMQQFLPSFLRDGMNGAILNDVSSEAELIEYAGGSVAKTSSQAKFLFKEIQQFKIQQCQSTSRLVYFNGNESGRDEVKRLLLSKTA